MSKSEEENRKLQKAKAQKLASGSIQPTTAEQASPSALDRLSSLANTINQVSPVNLLARTKRSLSKTADQNRSLGALKSVAQRVAKLSPHHISKGVQAKANKQIDKSASLRNVRTGVRTLNFLSPSNLMKQLRRELKKGLKRDIARMSKKPEPQNSKAASTSGKESVQPGSPNEGGPGKTEETKAVVSGAAQAEAQEDIAEKAEKQAERKASEHGERATAERVYGLDTVSKDEQSNDDQDDDHSNQSHAPSDKGWDRSVENGLSRAEKETQDDLSSTRDQVDETAPEHRQDESPELQQEEKAEQSAENNHSSGPKPSPGH